VEENMFKPVIVGMAVLAISGSSLVYAQQFGDHGGFGRWRAEHHHRLSADDMAAFTDARIAALKAGLELTPDQAKNWSPFEQAVRELAQLHIQQLQARQQRQQPGENAPSPFDRLAQRADNLAKTSAALKKLADAGAPLYRSLTDAQKGRFRILARMLRPHPHRAMFFWRGRDGDRGSGRGGAEFGPQHRTAPNGGDDNDAAPGNRL
jgi:soluble lytic murein transglycosylase-like protein